MKRVPRSRFWSRLGDSRDIEAVPHSVVGEIVQAARQACGAATEASWLTTEFHAAARTDGNTAA
ncbi:MAG TPA: hypothetical protein VIH43_03595, partial [Chthoniobacterales bacterium]